MRFLSYRDLRVSGKFIYIAYAIVFFVGLLNLCAMRTLRCVGLLNLCAMRTLRWENQVSVYTVDELGESYRRLYELAYGAAREAYAPYSRFCVGAALLLENGEIVCGNNQENAAYPSGLCAERTALFYAGARFPDVPVAVLAIAALKAGKRTDSVTPCGACRQVMLEMERRHGRPIRVMLCGEKEVYEFACVADLLPFSFSDEDLVSRQG